MRDLAIVAIALLLFLGLGIAIGVLIVSTISPGGDTRYVEDRDRQQRAEDEERPPRWPAV